MKERYCPDRDQLSPRRGLELSGSLNIRRVSRPYPGGSDIYRAIPGKPVAFSHPDAYPIDDARWNFSKPPGERAGIFIGTREWDVPSRNHLAAMLVARELSAQTGENVTVFNFDGRKGARLLDEIGFVSGKLRTLDRKSSYPEYLRVLASHKIVLQLDTSFVPGQVAGDALLCRVPCVGGNGAIDRLAFPESCGFNRSIAEIGQIAARLLTDRNDYEATVAKMETVAAQHLSFNLVAEKLRVFFGG